mmetsp:Transcript_27193/g.63684  ORF Transcript_27193/g.63684 Transcript_27193/m.63684 type:complete len:571 (+) Transcript_27193:70-1782(+)
MMESTSNQVAVQKRLHWLGLLIIPLVVAVRLGLGVPTSAPSIFATQRNATTSRTRKIQSQAIHAKQEQETIPMAPLPGTDIGMSDLGHNSTRSAQEVTNILHFPHKNKIVVQFKSNGTRKCPRPRLFGRLAGPYLTTIEWDYPPLNFPNASTWIPTVDSSMASSTQTVQQRYEEEPPWTTISGHYHVPQSGKYFVEIVTIMCDDLKFETNFSRICLEQPPLHRLTHPDQAYVQAVSRDREPLPSGASSLGFWKWIPPSHENKSVLSMEPNSTYPPLLTRYQLPGCRRRRRPTHCEVPTSTMRFQPYFHFEYANTSYGSSSSNQNNTPGILNLLPLLSRLTNMSSVGAATKTLRICFFGTSHSRYLTWSFREVLSIVKEQYGVDHIVDATYTMVAFPHWLQQPSIRDCQIVIVGLGQWTLKLRPLPLAGWYDGIANIIRNFQTGHFHFNDRLPHFPQKVWFRSTHFNPMGDEKLTCPMEDFRSPTHVEKYWEVVQFLVANASTTMTRDAPDAKRGMLSFGTLETHSIIKPLYDTGRDFNHVEGAITRVETAFMMYQVLSDFLQNLSPTTKE